MFQRVKSLLHHPERKRILTVTAVLLIAAVSVCTVQNGLRTKSSRVMAAEQKDLKDGSGSGKTTAQEAESMIGMKRQMAIDGIERLRSANENAAQETGAAGVQNLTEQEAHLKEIEAIEASILPGQYPIMGESSIQVEQMVAFFNTNGANYPSEELGSGGAPDIETFCQIYYDEAVAEGVRPEVAFAQTMKETGWLQYGGDASIAQFNFAGLGTTGGGVPGNSYADVRTGVRAQIQHLKAYATDQSLSQECVDDRYTYVTKGCAPFVEWLGQNENPEGYGWATGLNYGYDIVDMIHTMRSF